MVKLSRQGVIVKLGQSYFDDLWLECLLLRVLLYAYFEIVQWLRISVDYDQVESFGDHVLGKRIPCSVTSPIDDNVELL